MFLGREGGIAEIEPDAIRPQAVNRARDLSRHSQSVRVPAADDMKARQFLLFVRAESVSILVSRPIVASQLVSKNRKVDERIALQFARQVEAILIQLPTARGKSRYQTNLHWALILKTDSLEQADANKRPKLLILPAGEIEKAFLLQAGGETDRIVQGQLLSVFLEGPAYGHCIGAAEAALHRVIEVKTHVARVGERCLHVPVMSDSVVDIGGRTKCLGDCETLLFHSP